MLWKSCKRDVWNICRKPKWELRQFNQRLLQKWSQSQLLVFGRDLEESSGRKSGNILERKRSFRRTLPGDCWQGEAGGGISRRVPSYVTDSFIWLYLLSVLSPEWLLWRLSIRIFLSYMIWPSFMCIVSLQGVMTGNLL